MKVLFPVSRVKTIQVHVYMYNSCIHMYSTKIATIHIYTIHVYIPKIATYMFWFILHIDWKNKLTHRSWWDWIQGRLQSLQALGQHELRGRRPSGKSQYIVNDVLLISVWIYSLKCHNYWSTLVVNMSVIVLKYTKLATNYY